MKILNDINNGYRVLKGKGEIKDNEDREFFQNPFYELGSALWAIREVKKTYGGKKEKFDQVISEYVKNGYRNPNSAFTDGLLEDKIFSINANWTYPGWREFADPPIGPQSTLSPVIELLSGRRDPDQTGKDTPYQSFGQPEKPGLSRLLDIYLEFLPAERGISSLPNYFVDSTTNRPQRLKVIPDSQEQSTQNPRIAQDILDLLAAYRLDRVIHYIRLNKTAGALFTPTTRDVMLDTKFMLDENYKTKYPNLWRHILLHESGHAIQYLIEHFHDVPESQFMLLKLDRIIRKARSYPQFSRLYKPQGSGITHSFKLDDLEQDARKINESTLTDYPAEAYSNYSYDYGLNQRWARYKLINFTRMFLQEVSHFYNIPFSSTALTAFSPEEGSIYRYIRTKQIDQSRTFNNFSEFWKEIYPANRKQLDQFEKLVLDEIINRLGDLDRASGRKMIPPSDSKTDEWLKYLFNDVLPGTIASVVDEKFPQVQEIILQSQDTPEKKSQLLHALRLYRRQISFLAQQADRETFGELFAMTLRRNDSGVTTETLPNDLSLEETQKLIDEILDKLTANGYALLEDSGMNSEKQA